MTLEGTVVNGALVLADGSRLPEGTRVRLQLLEIGDDDEMTSIPDSSLPVDHPLAPYNREVELAILRESIEEMKSGRGGVPLDEFMAELAKEFNLPPADPE